MNLYTAIRDKDEEFISSYLKQEIGLDEDDIESVKAALLDRNGESLSLALRANTETGQENLQKIVTEVIKGDPVPPSDTTF